MNNFPKTGTYLDLVYHIISSLQKTKKPFKTHSNSAFLFRVKPAKDWANKIADHLVGFEEIDPNKEIPGCVRSFKTTYSFYEHSIMSTKDIQVDVQYFLPNYVQVVMKGLQNVSRRR